jgi:hypothetical protein
MNAHKTSLVVGIALLFGGVQPRTLSGPAQPRQLSFADGIPCRGQRAPATPMLGNYPATSMSLSTNTTVTPDAAPANTTSINISTSTNFKGRFEGYPATGVIRVTDAHPAGTYIVTVRAFDSGGASVDQDVHADCHDTGNLQPRSFRRHQLRRCS